MPDKTFEVELPPSGVEGTKEARIRPTEAPVQLVLDLGLAYESLTRPEVAETIRRMRK